MHVSALYIYPVKGIAAVAVQAAALDAFGLTNDRRFMIVDASGTFITQREHSQLAFLHGEVAGDMIVLRSSHAGALRVRVPHDGERVVVKVWRDSVPALDAGAAAADFLTRHVGFAARLVYMPDDTLRQVDRTYAEPGDRVSFADGYPLLLIGQSSLDELNRRLPHPVEMLRFRPNIVVSGALPHAEDSWRRIRMGGIECDVVKPCARCVVTTIDPATAVAGREPLRTLATYRRANGKVYFGQNLIHRAAGVIRVGDPVAVLSSDVPRPLLTT